MHEIAYRDIPISRVVKTHITACSVDKTIPNNHPSHVACDTSAQACDTGAVDLEKTCWINMAGKSDVALLLYLLIVNTEQPDVYIYKCVSEKQTTGKFPVCSYSFRQINISAHMKFIKYLHKLIDSSFVCKLFCNEFDENKLLTYLLFGPFSVLFGPFRFFPVLFGPFRFFLVLFGV